MTRAAVFALLAVGCKHLLGDPNRIIALEIVGPTSYTVQAGDTLHLRARARSANGDTVPGAVIEWAVLDTGTVRIVLDAQTGTAVPESAGTWHLQARVEDIRSDAIAVAVEPGAAAALRVTGMGDSVSAGEAISLTVSAVDGFGNAATSYAGTVHFTSSDPAASLPADYAFPAAAAGTHAFTGVVLRTPGTQSVTATDVATATITGARTGITVVASTAAPAVPPP